MNTAPDWVFRDLDHAKDLAQRACAYCDSTETNIALADLAAAVQTLVFVVEQLTRSESLQLTEETSGGGIWGPKTHRWVSPWVEAQQ